MSSIKNVLKNDILSEDSPISQIGGKEINKFFDIIKKSNINFLANIIKNNNISKYDIIDNTNGYSFIHYLIDKYNNDCYEPINKILSSKYKNKIINHQDNNGNTPLHIATINNNNNIIELLKKNGAERYIKNNENEIVFTITHENTHENKNNKYKDINGGCGENIDDDIFINNKNSKKMNNIYDSINDSKYYKNINTTDAFKQIIHDNDNIRKNEISGGDNVIENEKNNSKILNNINILNDLFKKYNKKIEYNNIENINTPNQICDKNTHNKSEYSENINTETLIDKIINKNNNDNIQNEYNSENINANTFIEKNINNNGDDNENINTEMLIEKIINNNNNMNMNGGGKIKTKNTNNENNNNTELFIENILNKKQVGGNKKINGTRNLNKNKHFEDNKYKYNEASPTKFSSDITSDTSFDDDNKNNEGTDIFKVTRIMNIKASKIHKKVVQKIMDILGIGIEDAKIYKAYLYKEVQNKGDMSNYERAVEMNNMATEEILKNIKQGDLDKLSNKISESLSEKEKGKKTNNSKNIKLENKKEKKEKKEKKDKKEKKNSETKIKKKDKKNVIESSTISSDTSYYE
jgi:hypothetical protein